jgi:hypothetical protein
MNSQNRVGLGLLMLAQNPVGALFALIAAIFLLIPIGLPLLAVFLLIKLLEVVLAKKPAATQRLEATNVVVMKREKW